MPTTETSSVLARAVRLTLETMCFSATEPCSHEFSADEVIATTVSFSGSLSGCLQLETTTAAGRWLTAAFLGLAPSDVDCDSSMASDTVGELGNVICGRFLSLLNPSANVKIYPPVIGRPPVTGRAAYNSADVSWHNFQSDSGPLRVAIHLT